MAELLHDEFGRIGVDHVGDLMHRALLHQILDEVDGAFRHAVRQFLDGDGFGNDHLARDLLARLLDTHRLELFLLALALERGERTHLRFAVEVRDRQLLALASFVGELYGRARHLNAAGPALAAVVIFDLFARDDGALRTNRLLYGGGIGRSSAASNRSRQIDLARPAGFARHVGRVAAGARRMFSEMADACLRAVLARHRGARGIPSERCRALLAPKLASEQVTA